jgi:fucose 4-O-acetylase-like acetyltransferase
MYSFDNKPRCRGSSSAAAFPHARVAVSPHASPVVIGRREAWADNAKGIAIVLVVFEHTIGGLISAGIMREAALGEQLSACIYSFHVNVFFVVAGWFASRQATRDGYLGAKARTLLYPFALWSILTALVASMVPQSATNSPVAMPELALGLVWRPIGHFWFLPTLFVLSAFACAIARNRLTPVAVTGVALALWSVPLSPGVFASIGPIPRACCRALPYFVCGMIAPRFIRYEARSFVLVACGCVAFAATWVLGALHSVEMVSIVPATTGLIGVFAVSVALGHRAAWLRQLGRWSLPIYLGHVMSAAAVRFALLKCGVMSPVFHLVLGATAGILVPCALGWLDDRSCAPYLLKWERRVSDSAL